MTSDTLAFEDDRYICTCGMGVCCAKHHPVAEVCPFCNLPGKHKLDDACPAMNEPEGFTLVVVGCADHYPPLPECNICQLAAGKRAGDLPEHNPSLDNSEQGLYRKFTVRRVDRSDRLGGKHDRCDYFVLDVTHDPHAKAALGAYADAVRVTYPQLADDIERRYGLSYADTDTRPSFDELQKWALLTWNQHLSDQKCYEAWLLAHPQLHYRILREKEARDKLKPNL